MLGREVAAPGCGRRDHGDLSVLPSYGPCLLLLKAGQLVSAPQGGRPAVLSGEEVPWRPLPAPRCLSGPRGCAQTGQDAGEGLWLCLRAAAEFAVRSVSISPHSAASLISSPTPGQSGAQSEEAGLPWSFVLFCFFFSFFKNLWVKNDVCRR